MAKFESSEEFVSVPLKLLARVLDQAEDDNRCVESEFSVSTGDKAEFSTERKLIDELRKAAGISVKSI